MTDEYLVDADAPGHDLVLASAARLPLAVVREDPRFVEPVLVVIEATALEAARASAATIRDELEHAHGFAPRDVHVIASDASGWRLVVDGEVVDACSEPIDPEDVERVLRAALTRELWRMLRPDDVAELLAFAHRMSPVAIDAAIPSKFSIADLHRVLVRLLREGIPIAPLDRIVEAMAADPRHGGGPVPTDAYVERLRVLRRRGIVDRCRQADGSLRIVGLSEGARNACDHLRLNPAQPHDRRRRFQERIRAGRDDIARVHGLDPFVVVTAPAARRAASDSLRPLGIVVVSDEEIHDQDATWVEAVLGAGMHVPPAAPPSPPLFPDVSVGSGWSWGTTSSATQVAGDVVDVEIIE